MAATPVTVSTAHLREGERVREGGGGGGGVGGTLQIIQLQFGVTQTYLEWSTPFTPVPQFENTYHGHVLKTGVLRVTC